MSISLRGTPDEDDSGGQPWTSLTLNKPSGVAVGDLLLVAVGHYNDIADTPGTAMNDVSGWTRHEALLHTYNDNSVFKRTVYTRIATGSEGSTFTVGRSSLNCYGAAAYVAFKGGTGKVLSSPSFTDGTPQETDNASCVAPSVSGTTGQGLICGFTYEDPVGATVTPPSGMSLAIAVSESVSGQSPRVYYETLGSTGATGTRTLVATSANRNEGWSLLVNEVNAPVTPVIELRGTPQQADNGGSSWSTLTVNKPSGVAVGDLLVVSASIYYGTSVGTGADTVSGWTLDQQHVHTYNDGSKFERVIYYRVADGSEASTFTLRRGGNNTWGAVSYVAFKPVTAGHSISVQSLTNGTPQTTDSTSCVAPSVTSGSANQSLICGFAFEDPAGDTVTAPTGMTVAIEPSEANGMQATRVWYETLGATGSTGTRTLVATFAQRNVGWTLLVNDVTSTAGSFASAPAIASETSTAYTINYTTANASNVYFAAYPHGTATPSVAAVKAGTGAHGTATEAATNTSDSIVLTVTDSPPYPVYDIYAVASGSGGDSALASLIRKFLDPVSGKNHVVCAAPMIGVMEGTGAVDLDVMVPDAVTAPGNYALTFRANGSFSIAAGGDNTEQTAYMRWYKVSAKTWGAAAVNEKFYVNNPVPQRSTGGKNPVEYRVRVGVAMTPLHVPDSVTDDDPLSAVLQSGAVLHGLSFSTVTSNITGTGDRQEIQASVFRVSDTAGDYYDLPMLGIAAPARPLFVGFVPALRLARGSPITPVDVTVFFDHEDPAVDPATDMTYELLQRPTATTAGVTVATAQYQANHALSVADTNGIERGDYIASETEPTNFCLVLEVYGATKMVEVDRTMRAEVGDQINRRRPGPWPGNGTLALTPDGMFYGTPDTNVVLSELLIRCTDGTVGEIVDSNRFTLTVADDQAALGVELIRTTRRGRSF